jgi:uncharacterized protein YacL
MDGELTLDEQRVWQAHLDRCAQCQREWEMIAMVEVALAEAPEPPALSPDFAVATAKRVVQRQRLRRLLSAIVGTLIVVVIAALILRYVGAVYEALEWSVSAVLSARQMLFRALMQTFVGLILSWKAVLPFIGAMMLLLCLIVMPNGIMVTIALLCLSRRRREFGLMEAINA